MTVNGEAAPAFRAALSSTNMADPRYALDVSENALTVVIRALESPPKVG